jgi:hypothetical protein
VFERGNRGAFNDMNGKIASKKNNPVGKRICVKELGKAKTRFSGHNRLEQLGQKDKTLY